MNKLNWSMPECLWSNCPISCCGEKSVFTTKYWTEPTADMNTPSNIWWVNVGYTINWTKDTSYATLITKEESVIYKKKIKLTVKAVNIVIAISNWKPVTQESFILSKCLWKNGCKIENNKPIICKLFPFDSNANIALETDRCPKSIEIAQNLNNIKQALIHRKEIKNKWYGLGSNELFASNVLDIIIKSWKTPNWNLQDLNFNNEWW